MHSCNMKLRLNKSQSSLKYGQTSFTRLSIEAIHNVGEGYCKEPSLIITDAKG